MQSHTEENYLKSIYHLAEISNPVQTNAIAEKMNTKAASVTDMLRKLADKKLVDYMKYQGVSLTEVGKSAAIAIIRKHRLWEVFLVEKLNFKWDQVHEVAEELEHIKSTFLVEQLDEFLNYPKIDPHGDPIPDKNGKFTNLSFVKLNKLKVNETGTIVGVSEHTPSFFKHLDKLSLSLGKKVKLLELSEFDGSVELELEGQKINISREVVEQILVNKL